MTLLVQKLSILICTTHEYDLVRARFLVGSDQENAGESSQVRLFEVCTTVRKREKLGWICDL